MYDWDDRKRQITLEKHGIDFVRAVTVFESPHVILRGKSETEDRWIAIGPIGSKVIAVVFTMRGDVTRIITARHARKRERQIYEIQIHRRDPPNGGPH